MDCVYVQRFHKQVNIVGCSKASAKFAFQPHSPDYYYCVQYYRSAYPLLRRFGLLKKKTMSRFEGGEDNVDCDAQTAIDDVFFATPVLGKDRVNDNQAPYSSPSGPSACSEKLQPTVDANFVISFFRQCSKYPRVETLLTKALSSALSSVGFWISVCTSNYLNLYVVLMEYFAQHNVETITTAFANFCHALGGLRVFTQVALVEFWSDYCAADLQRMVESLQRFLTAEVSKQNTVMVQ